MTSVEFALYLVFFTIQLFGKSSNSQVHALTVSPDSLRTNDGNSKLGQVVLFESDELPEIDPDNKRKESQTFCPFPKVMNGQIRPVEYENNNLHKVRVVCDSGFKLEGWDDAGWELYLTCSRNGKWIYSSFLKAVKLNTSGPNCVSRCPILPPLINGTIHVKPSFDPTIELSAKYMCWSGLVLDPPLSPVRDCIKGEWTGKSMECVPAGCERPSSIRDGFFTVRKRTTREGTEYAYPVNSSIEYHCSPGYHLNGPDVLTCSGQRGWVPWTLPSCSPIDTGDQEEHSSGRKPVGCYLPRTPDNGHFVFTPSLGPVKDSRHEEEDSSLVPVNHMFRLVCNEGFTPLISHTTRFCTKLGWWPRITVADQCLRESSDSETAIQDTDHDFSSVSDYEEGGGNGDGANLDDDDDTDGWMVPVTTAFVVVLVLSVIVALVRFRFSYHQMLANRRDPPTASSSARPPPRPMGEPQPSADVGPRATTAGGRDQDRVTLIALLGDQQAPLPTYDEAVRTKPIIDPFCPSAPPPYELVSAITPNREDVLCDANSGVQNSAGSVTGETQVLLLSNVETPVANGMLSNVS